MRTLCTHGPYLVIGLLCTNTTHTDRIRTLSFEGYNRVGGYGQIQERSHNINLVGLKL